MQKKKVIVIGTGMGGLTAAAMLTFSGFEVTILEQNWMPGGCSSSYWRKDFWFETGATTLVGVDDGMPLHYFLKKTGIFIDYDKLDVPMQVHQNGSVITRFQDLQQWIDECSSHYGQKKEQKKFWETCYSIASNVWKVSSKQLAFPPKNLTDFWSLAKGFEVNQISLIKYAFRSVDDLLTQFGLKENLKFCAFVDEQLLITAQNTAKNVNILFGATALCYTNFTNCYVRGGLINLIQPIIAYLETKKQQIHYRTCVEKINKNNNKYILITNKGNFEADIVVAAIPANNLEKIYSNFPKQLKNKLLPSEKLYSAFQLGLGLKIEAVKNLSCLHHQIHLKNPLPIIGSKSIFISFSPPFDETRAEKGTLVASVSTHILNPKNTILLDEDQAIISKKIIDELDAFQLIKADGIIYQHTSGPGSWLKWTKRAFGFVGGYPQYLHIKPWQMLESRVDNKGLYLAGDSVYPGQGIPGVTLSGLIAWKKILLDN